jgi:2-hydroxychromene-2-carboxylate isomerase
VGGPGTVEEALADGVFDLPAVVHGGRVFRDLRLRDLADALDRPTPPLPDAESTLPVDVYLDLADPASFVALTHAERLCGRGVRWHLINGKSLRLGFGVGDPVRDGTDLERAWWRSELDRVAPMPLDWSALDVRPTLAARAAAHLGLERTVLMHLFHSMWVHGRPLGDRDALVAALGELSLDGAAVIADADPSGLRTSTTAAEAAGVFTTPTFVVGRQTFTGLNSLQDAGAAARVVTNLVTIGR